MQIASRAHLGPSVTPILSSQVGDGRVFERIMSDLKRPGAAEGAEALVEYVLEPLVATEPDASPESSESPDFILRAEDFGIPQARHRVIIIGIRKDIHAKLERFIALSASAPPTVDAVLRDLPPSAHR